MSDEKLVKILGDEDLIKLGVPGEHLFEKERNWMTSESVAVGDWISVGEEHEDFDQLVSQAEEFNAWFLGPENADNESKIGLTTSTNCEYMTVDNEMIPVAVRLFLAPVNRAIDGREWADGDLFAKAQRTVEAYKVYQASHPVVVVE